MRTVKDSPATPPRRDSVMLQRRQEEAFVGRAQ